MGIPEELNFSGMVLELIKANPEFRSYSGTRFPDS